MNNIKFVTNRVAEKTTYKSLKDAYQRNQLSIVVFVDAGVFYLETFGCSDRTYKIAVRETKRLFPDLKYLYDLENED